MLKQTTFFGLLLAGFLLVGCAESGTIQIPPVNTTPEMTRELAQLTGSFKGKKDAAGTNLDISVSQFKDTDSDEDWNQDRILYDVGKDKEGDIGIDLLRTKDTNSSLKDQTFHINYYVGKDLLYKDLTPYKFKYGISYTTIIIDTDEFIKALSNVAPNQKITPRLIFIPKGETKEYFTDLPSFVFMPAA